MNPTPPPIPPEAQPFWLVQAVGRETVAYAWRACFELGVAAGRLLKEFDFWKGVVLSSICWVGLILLALVVAQFLTVASRRRG